MSTMEQFETVVIGGGQAGLAAGYFLARRGGSFVILDENARSGDAWRRRWDSLRLFTPSQFNGLPGKPFPQPPFCFPTKDEVADYLEQYAAQFALPVRRQVRVQRLARDAQGGFQIATSAGTLLARNVIVATGPAQRPYTPEYARQLDPRIQQLHSSAYCNPRQVAAQKLLVVGAGNSGVEIGLELARAGKQVWLAGRDVGRIPADKLGRPFGGRLYWFVMSKLLSVRTPIGRKMQPQVALHGTPLIRSTRQDVQAAGIELVGPVTGAQAGRPVLAGGSAPDVDGVLWATGFRPDFTWIDLPVFDAHGYPRHRAGVVSDAPGLYFVGLPFQTALSSVLLGGVGTDAQQIVAQIGRGG